jgi:hypothetical protein
MISPSDLFSQHSLAASDPMAHLRMAAGECIAAESWEIGPERESALCLSCSAGRRAAASREVYQARPRVWRGPCRARRISWSSR